MSFQPLFGETTPSLLVSSNNFDFPKSLLSQLLASKVLQFRSLIFMLRFSSLDLRGLARVVVFLSFEFLESKSFLGDMNFSTVITTKKIEVFLVVYWNIKYVLRFGAGLILQFRLHVNVLVLAWLQIWPLLCNLYFHTYECFFLVKKAFKSFTQTPFYALFFLASCLYSCCWMGF